IVSHILLCTWVGDVVSKNIEVVAIPFSFELMLHGLFPAENEANYLQISQEIATDIQSKVESETGFIVSPQDFMHYSSHYKSTEEYRRYILEFARSLYGPKINNKYNGDIYILGGFNDDCSEIQLSFVAIKNYTYVTVYVDPATVSLANIRDRISTEVIKYIKLTSKLLDSTAVVSMNFPPADTRNNISYVYDSKLNMMQPTQKPFSITFKCE
ncbi:MAG: hypothetical protein K8I00_00830, partial [Candidatus Omnitrophica bacterium]|nr:hypothetical protein [Candidatus Omnitrophota bacterium]